MPKFLLHHPDGTSVKFGLNGQVFTIGRAENNDIVLRDGSSSSHHAVLKLTDCGDFSISDLESTNHTRVNGQIISSLTLMNGGTALSEAADLAVLPEFTGWDQYETIHRRNASVMYIRLERELLFK